MASVTFEHVYKRFGDVIAVNDLNIQIADKEFLVFVGPSGCGKTTSLRLLGRPGRDLRRPHPDRRPRRQRCAAQGSRHRHGVPELCALPAHERVRQHGLRPQAAQDARRPRSTSKVKEAAELLGISQFLDRKPKQLSGGQRQRVAVGRAIVRNPKVFLFDEPLSNLDAKLRVQTRADISKLHQRLGTTFIYVTHDQVEAMTMATRIAVHEGRPAAADRHAAEPLRPSGQHLRRRLHRQPVDELLRCRPWWNRMASCSSTAARSSCRCPSTRRPTTCRSKGKKVIFGIRPEDVHAEGYAAPGIIARADHRRGGCHRVDGQRNLPVPADRQEAVHRPRRSAHACPRRRDDRHDASTWTTCTCSIRRPRRRWT